MCEKGDTEKRQIGAEGVNNKERHVEWMETPEGGEEVVKLRVTKTFCVCPEKHLTSNIYCWTLVSTSSPFLSLSGEGLCTCTAHAPASEYEDQLANGLASKYQNNVASMLPHLRCIDCSRAVHSGPVLLMDVVYIGLS